eukprot:6244430-Prorocentrum_lima.AAC.1
MGYRSLVARGAQAAEGMMHLVASVVEQGSAWQVWGWRRLLAFPIRTSNPYTCSRQFGRPWVKQLA